MNIYSIIPVAAMLAYIPLLATTATLRPMKRTQLFFAVFLVAAITWSLVDYFFRANLFPQHNLLLLKLILVAYAWMAAQFHVFTSSFFPPSMKRWLPLAWIMLGSVILMVALDFTPVGLIVDGDKLYPEYGYGVAVMAAMLVGLLGRNLYIFWRKLKVSENMVLSNQIFSLRLALLVLTVFTLAALLPWAREFPVSHIGNMINAIVLSYAAVGHQLVDIRLVLQRGLAWVVLTAAGIAGYWLLLLALDTLLQVNMDPTTVLIVTLVVLVVLGLVYRLRHLLYSTIGKAFLGPSYDYRRLLIGFTGRIQNVFSLHRQGGELLYLVTRAVNCQRAGLLFPNHDGNAYSAQVYYPDSETNPLRQLVLTADSPITRFLNREHRPLTRNDMATMPEFQALWETEKEQVRSNRVELFLPLVSRNRLIGVLVITERQTGRYSLDDFILLEQVTSRVAVSIEKEYLHEQLKERETELQVINRSSAILASSLDINHVFNHFVRELSEVMKISWAAIFEIQNDTASALAVHTNLTTEWRSGDSDRLADSPLAWLAEQRSAIISDDITAEWRFTGPRWRFSSEVRSLLCLPLVLKDRVIGGLVLGSEEKHAYEMRHISALEQITSQIGMAIENSKLFTEAERLARVDELTGLLNRRSLDEVLGMEIERHMRYDGFFSLIILDLDSFKHYNDTFGHLAGDVLLQQVGLLIRNSVRRSDQAFRYGGDEFAILLPHTDETAALEVVERVRNRIASEAAPDGANLTSSLGLACWPLHGIYDTQILHAADQALYQAKGHGGDQCRSAAEDEVSRDRAIAETIESLSGLNGDQALKVLFALAVTTDSRNPFETGHSRRVTEHAIEIADLLELKRDVRERISTCARLHDIGKCNVDARMLRKPGRLTTAEWDAMKQHPGLGATIMSRVDSLRAYLPGIRHHHERYDGTGYPDGIAGEAIPLEARIIALADAYSAMTSERSYSHALTVSDALAEISKGAGSQFDPELARVFVKLIELRTSGLSIIEKALSNTTAGGTP